MKQTNNAIKFLMAQYRAIFKNANIAMAVALATAALAAGQAQAAEIALSQDDKAPTESLTITGSDTAPSTGGYINDLTIANGGTLTFDGSTTANTNHIRVQDGLTIAEGGKLVLKGKAGSNNDGKGYGVVGTFDDNAWGGALNVNGGTVDISASQIQMNSVSLNNAKVTIGTNVSDDSASNYADNALINANVNGTDGGDFTVAGESTITMNAGSALVAKTFNLKAGTISMNGTGADDKSAVIRAYDSGNGVLNVDGATIEASGSGNVIGGNTVKLTSGAINVAESGVLTVAGWLDKTKDLEAAISGDAVAVNMSNFTVDGKGKLVIGNKASGGTVTVTGNSSITSNVESYADLTVSGSSAVLTVNKAALTADSGLFAGQAQTGGGGTGGGGNQGGGQPFAVTAGKGDITLANGGTLKIADTTSAASFNVGSLKFASAAAANTIGITTAGAIAGDFLTVSGTITSGSTLTVKALDTLTLGSASFDSSKSGAGVAALEAKNVTLVPSGAAFTLQNVLNLSSDADGKIAGADLTVSGGAVNIKAGNYTFDKALSVASGSLSIADGAKLTLAGGNFSTTKTDGSVTVDGAILDASAATDYAISGTITLSNTAELHLDDSKVLSGGALVTGKLAAGSVVSDAASKIVFTDVQMTQEQFGKLVTDSKFNGLFGGVTITGYDIAGEKDIGQIQSNYTQGHEDVQAAVTGGTVSGNYSVGNVQLKDDATELTLGTNGNLTLVNSSAADGAGKFVSDKDGNLAGVKMSADNSLVLDGNGSIGAITTTAGKGSVTVGAVAKEGTAPSNVTVVGGMGGTGAELADVLTNNANLTVQGDVYTNNLDVNGGSVAGNKIVLGDGQTYDAQNGTGLDSLIAGDVAADSLSFKASTTGDLKIINDANVQLDTLTAAQNINIFVGQDGVDTSSATLEVGTLGLGGGALIVDPEFTEKAAIAAVKNLSQKDQATGAEIVDGKIGVGKNAAVGIGFNSRQEVEALLATYGYLVDGPKGMQFDEKSTLHGALVLNAPLKIANNQGVKIDTSSTNLSANQVSGNEFNMGPNSGLVLTDAVYGVDANGTKTGVAVTLEGGAANSVKIDGGKIILAGNFTAADSNIQVFSGTTGFSVSGTGIQIESANKLISATLGSDGKVQAGTWEFDKAKKLATYYQGASAPVRDLLQQVMRGELVGTELGNVWLGQQANSTDTSGVLADAAAHAATYAGAQQAAVASVTTMADAVLGRIGSLGVEAASISATGSQANGGVWVTPMYKSMDSDGFDAQGASYGSDVDLAGVAFGTDTVNGNMRFGAVFNLGSGEAEGKGNGSGLKDDFDYYGFGIYSAMGFGNFALVGDASLTVINHDVEGAGLNGEADTSAVTMGVTGQYTFATPMIDVTPHLGARFIRLDTDAYDLNSDKGVLATTDFEVQNVFSIPLGVTLSKAFTTGSWSLAPSADFTLTFNTGDTEAESTTQFTGVKPIGLTTEVLDEVQYGLTLGASAQYGAFGTSFGVNYTGSSNTDSFGVNAQARYVF